MLPYKWKRVSFQDTVEALNTFQLRLNDYIYGANISLFPNELPRVYRPAEDLLLLMVRREPPPKEVRALYEVRGFGGSSGN
jgi:hypothetical protein